MNAGNILTFHTALLLITGILRTYYSRVRYSQDPITMTRPRERLASALTPVILIILAAWPHSSFLLSLSPVISSLLFPANFYLGCLLLTVGYLTKLAGLLEMGKSWRIGIDYNTKDNLILGGVFRYSRNPIFLGLILCFIGYAVLLPSLITIFLAVSTFISVHLQILSEEKFLEEKYGAPYLAFKAQVSRYLGHG